MNAVTRCLVIAALLLVTAHRLPAPIQEVPETPTPVPKQSAKPKPKPTIKPKVTSESPENSTRREASSPQPKSEAVSNQKPFNIPQSQMTASATSQHGGYEASKAIDGNVTSMWSTPFNALWFGSPLVTLPQSIMLNLGGTYFVNMLHYLPRQDVWANGTIVSYKIYVSTDGSRFAQVTAGSWADDHAEKTATFAPTKASYIRLEAVSGHLKYASAAELNVTAVR
jgi:F5/8 type C domain-containing protein